MATPAYADLEIRILRKQGERGYPVELTVQGRQTFDGGSLGADVLDRWKFDPIDPAASGQALFDCLLADAKTREGWQRIWGQHEQRRVRLRIDPTAPELDVLPWEALHYGGLCLAADARTPFSRYLVDDTPPGEPVAGRPLKLLVAIASPDLSSYPDLHDIDVGRETKTLREALKEASPTELQIDFMEGVVTLTAIQDALGKGYHVLHLIAHGRFDPAGNAALCLADAENQARWVRTDEFVKMPNSVPEKPRLVFLASCQSAARSPTDALRGFAPALVRGPQGGAGIPAVLAMQQAVDMESARAFARAFYRELRRHGEVDLAGNQARAAVGVAGLPGDSIPVLYSRLRDNRLFVPVRRDETPFMADDLPPGFVPRPDEFKALIAHLCAPEVGTQPSPVAVTAALRGAGGYGKTTLVQAVCHDERVQERFADGVLWVTLGERPDVLGGLRKLYAAVSGERPAFIDVEDAAAALVRQWGDRRFLVVIDDVWDAAHLHPFLRGGVRCARLITTRNSATLPPNARTVDVDAMRNDQASALLGAGLPISGGQALRALAARLGEWPLLLKLANGALREKTSYGLTLPEALAELDEELSAYGLTAFDARDPQQRSQAVSATMEVGLRRLSQDERARYVELAVYPEDVEVPLASLERLWAAGGRMRRVDVRRLCQRLYRLSLFLSYDARRRTVRLHDVMRAYLAQEAGSRMQALHGRLLDAHEVDRWPDMSPDEPYLWRYLAYHLCQAGRADELRALLLDFGWLQAKLEAAGINALLVDYDLALPTKGGRRRQERKGREQALSLVQGMLRLSAQALAHDKSQLAGQLRGRLLLFEQRDLRGLVRQAGRWQGAPWLCPLNACLEPPGGPLLCTLSGHGDWVRAVAVTPDGSRAVSASADGTLKVWDLEGGTEQHTLSGHGASVLSVAVTPDGSRAVSASADGTLKVWDLEGGTEQHTLSGHGASVLSVAVTPDGSRAVSASADGTLKVWDLEGGTEQHTLSGHGASVLSVAVTPDGSRAVSASADGTLKVWDLEGGTEQHTLSGHGASVLSVAVTPDGSRAVSASADGTLKVWDLDKGRIIAGLDVDDALTTCAAAPDGRTIVAGDRSGRVHILRLEGL